METSENRIFLEFSSSEFLLNIASQQYFIVFYCLMDSKIFLSFVFLITVEHQ